MRSKGNRLRPVPLAQQAVQLHVVQRPAAGPVHLSLHERQFKAGPGLSVHLSCQHLLQRHQQQQQPGQDRLQPVRQAADQPSPSGKAACQRRHYSDHQWR